MKYKALIESHYKEQAKNHKTALTSTMFDLNTRQLEINTLLSYLKDGQKCLEVGCGNGGASLEISKKKKLDLICIDFSSEMIGLAKRRSQRGVRGKVEFKKMDVLELEMPEKFDAIFTERCIINLLDWKDQRAALKKMEGVLKKGGRLILLEAFKDGAEELNTARKEIGLEPIFPAYHNLHLDKEQVIKYLAPLGVEFIEESNFLSSYYFGSRVLYPALAKLAKKKVIYNSFFVKFFTYLPPYGNYSHIKILVFRKKYELSSS